MSDIVQWMIVGVIVVAAVVFLVKRLTPSRTGCCSGCSHAASCPQAKAGLSDCPSPENKVGRP